MDWDEDITREDLAIQENIIVTYRKGREKERGQWKVPTEDNVVLNGYISAHVSPGLCKSNSI